MRARSWLPLLVSLLLLPGWGWANCTQQSLNTEFTTDPTGRTYASCAPGNDQCVLDKFNSACTDAACKVDQIVSWAQIYEVIDNDELKVVMADQTLAPLVNLAATVPSFNMATAEVRQKLLDGFPSPKAPVTNTAIKALQQKNVPRSQIVCGRPGTLADVSCGMRGEGCS